MEVFNSTFTIGCECLVQCSRFSFCCLNARLLIICSIAFHFIHIIIIIIICVLCVGLCAFFFVRDDLLECRNLQFLEAVGIYRKSIPSKNEDVFESLKFTQSVHSIPDTYAGISLQLIAGRKKKLKNKLHNFHIVMLHFKCVRKLHSATFKAEISNDFFKWKRFKKFDEYKTAEICRPYVFHSIDGQAYSMPFREEVCQPGYCLKHFEKSIFFFILK